MCLIILKPIDGVINKADLKQAFYNNKDGVGFAYTDFREVKTHKEVYNNFNSFYKDYLKYKMLSEQNCSSLLLHFRFATNGAINKPNCHPFYIDNATKDLVVAHNGIIWRYAGNKNKSDTKLYIKKVLQNLPAKFHRNNTILKLIEKDIGQANKLVFLDKDNIYKIVNENQGQWVNGCWYSYPIRVNNYNYDDDKYYNDLAEYYNSLYN